MEILVLIPIFIGIVFLASFQKIKYRRKKHRWKSPGEVKPYSSATFNEPAFKPYKLNDSLLTVRETEFYTTLKIALKNQPYIIAIKPRLADFINVTYHQYHNKREFYFYFNKINAKHVDFLICDKVFKPLLAIELDDSTHSRLGRRDRDDFVNYLYKTVELPVLHVFDYSLLSLENRLSEMLPDYNQTDTAPISGGVAINNS